MGLIYKKVDCQKINHNVILNLIQDLNTVCSVNSESSSEFTHTFGQSLTFLMKKTKQFLLIG